MKKYTVTIQNGKNKKDGKLQIKEKELFIECEHEIITIPFSNIINSNLKEKELQIETEETTILIISENADIIANKIKDYKKIVKPKAEPKKSDPKILEDILNEYDNYMNGIENKNEMLFIICDSDSNDLMDYYIQNEDFDNLTKLKNLKKWEFFLGLYKYILEKIDHSKKTEEFFRNLFPEVLDEFQEMLENQDTESLKNYQYAEKLEQVNTWFLKTEQALEIRPELGESLPKYEEFKTFLKKLETAYNNYVKPKTKLNIFLNIIKEKKKRNPDDPEEILKEVSKKYMKFHVLKYCNIFAYASEEYHALLKQELDLDPENLEDIENILDLANNQFYMSLLIYCYNKVDNSEKTKEFFKNLFPNLVDGILESSQEKLQELGYNNYEKVIKDIISLTMRMKKQKEQKIQNGEDIGESYKMYDEIEPYLQFLEKSYNKYVNPQTPLNILVEHQTNVVENQTEASNKAFWQYYLPIILMVIMIIKFLFELFGEKGIIMELGWFSVIFFVILIIWIAIGSSGKSLTCETCGKWNSLKLTKDYIIDSKDSWKTKVEYINNRRIEKQVPIRIDVHEKHFICENCHNECVRYIQEETEL